MGNCPWEGALGLTGMQEVEQRHREYKAVENPCAWPPNGVVLGKSCSTNVPSFHMSEAAKT